MRCDIDENSIREFGEHISAEGGSLHTRQRYEHDAKMFVVFLGQRKITPKILEKYKVEQLAKYSDATVKTMLFGVNKYLEFMGCKHRISSKDLTVRREKISDDQLTVNEYLSVLSAVKSYRDNKLYVIVETICSAGLKYSELKYLTVEAAETGLLVLPYGVRKSGGNVYLPRNLCIDLLQFCRNNGIYHGLIFLTKFGNFPDRGNMTEALKEACKNTGIDSKKLSMRALKNFYIANFENIRNEMTDLIDEDIRVLHSPGFAECSENSFKSIAQKWFNSVEYSLTFATQARYFRILEEHILPILGNMDCRRITQVHVDSVIEKVYDLSLRMRANILRVMWLILDYAKESGLRIRVPQYVLRRVNNCGVSLRILADDESDRFVKCLKNSDSLICTGTYLALNLGIRAEELCALKRKDLDLERRTLEISKIVISRKEKRKERLGNTEEPPEAVISDVPKRVIFLPEFLADFLRPVYDKIPSDCYLISGCQKRAYEAKTVENKVRKIASECGILDVDFAAVRDTFGARCAENGLEPEMLGAIMGSENVEKFYPEGRSMEENPLEFLREAY